MITPPNLHLSTEWSSLHRPSPSKSDIEEELVTTSFDLVYLQDQAGRYLSFYWSQAEANHLQTHQLVGNSFETIFKPVDLQSYTGCIQEAIATSSSQQLTCLFHCLNHQLSFDLTISPIVGSYPQLVLVTGHASKHSGSSYSGSNSTLSVRSPILTPNSDSYYKLLALMTWNIRHTLELDVIWHQIVSDLGKALSVSYGCICPYKNDLQQVQVISEYHQPDVDFRVEPVLKFAAYPYLGQALKTLKPTLVDQSFGDGQVSQILAIASHYQHQPNSLILLYRQHQPWQTVEIELLQDVAEQIGIAIAHASLFAESQAIAAELQRVNTSLLEQHKVIEEAQRQAEEASRLKSEFLANTSHELRTPLNGMIGFLKLIMDGMADDPEEQQEFLSEAYQSAIHLLNLINDILDIAKIEAGKMQLELTPVGLDELFSQVENFTKPQALQKKLSFEIIKPATYDEIILLGNYQRLLQVMLNLVGNAVKFTHEGGITISAELIKGKVQVHNQELPGMVMVRVEDTGIGVSLEKQNKLFQSFSQVDGSRTRQYGGTGLGLAISQKLVEAMSGVVHFYSMGEGLGSTVTFTVPLYQEPVLQAEA